MKKTVRARTPQSSAPITARVVVVLALLALAAPVSAELVTRDAVVSRAEGVLRALYPDAEAVEIEIGEIPGLEAFAGRNVDISVRLASATDRRGALPMSAELRQEGKRAGWLRFSADVRVYRTVAVADRRIDRHEALDGDAVRFERRDIRLVSGNCVVDGDGLEGVRARRIVSDGTVLTRSHLQPIPIISRGDKVVAVATYGGIVVSAAAVALEDGGKGEEISVRNERSGKKVRAVVVSRNRVEVRSGQLAFGGGR